MGAGPAWADPSAQKRYQNALNVGPFGQGDGEVCLFSGGIVYGECCPWLPPQEQLFGVALIEVVVGKLYLWGLP